MERGMERKRERESKEKEKRGRKRGVAGREGKRRRNRKDSERRKEVREEREERGERGKRIEGENYFTETRMKNRINAIRGNIEESREGREIRIPIRRGCRG